MRKLVSAITLLAAFNLFGQPWLEQYNQSLEYYEEGALDKALVAAESALNIFKADFPDPHPNTAAILRHLSVISFDQGRDATAVAYVREEIQVFVSLGDDQSVNFINALNNMGILRNFRSEYAEAARVYERALEIAPSHYDASSVDLAILKGHYATALFNLKKDVEAARLFEQSVSILGNEQEPPYDYFSILYNYASLQLITGNYTQAERRFVELKQLYAQMESSTEYAGILLKLADVYDQMGQFAKAIRVYEEAISVLKSLGETSSQDYIIAQNNLSLDLQKTGNFTAARTTMTELLKVQESKKVDDPKAYVITATNYANLLIREGGKCSC